MTVMEEAAKATGDCMASKWMHQRLPGDIRCSHRQVFFTATGLLVEDIVLEEIPAGETRPMKRRK